MFRLSESTLSCLLQFLKKERKKLVFIPQDKQMPLKGLRVIETQTLGSKLSLKKKIPPPHVDRLFIELMLHVSHVKQMRSQPIHLTHKLKYQESFFCVYSEIMASSKSNMQSLG